MHPKPHSKKVARKQVDPGWLSPETQAGCLQRPRLAVSSNPALREGPGETLYNLHRRTCFPHADEGLELR